ncbi:MAG: polyketide cyclase [Sphingobium sp.]|nr:MAG: polyketide cyclase [Sphingobium sp.]
MSDGELGILLARIERLEAENAIRRVMADYMALCDRLDPQTPLEQLGALFTRQALWEGRGSRYASAFGRHEGREAIVAMLARYCDPPHFAFNAHYLASETIEVIGDRATGRWMMLQASTYATGASDLRSAELSIDFLVEDGVWRISHFRTTNLFSRPVSRWDDPAAVPVPSQSDAPQGAE